LAFETRLDSIPAAESYLPPPPPARVQDWEQRLREHLGASGKLRIGICWSGRAQHSNDHNRSMPLQTLRHLFAGDASFVSLQKDPKPGDRALVEASGIID